MRPIKSQVPVDPAGGCCYWGSTKPCKSRDSFGSTGEMLSNTLLTCLLVWDSLGKLRVIPDRGIILECFFLQSIGARRWGSGGLGCWRGNGPPSRRSVRAVRAGARRGTLRYWSQPYGVQQARNLYNARKCDKGILSAHAQHGLLPRVNTLENKWWVRLVPAGAVTPAPRVAIVYLA